MDRLYAKGVKGFMRRKEFIDIILNGISDTFDIYHNYWFNDRKFVIYAYNYKNRDKFGTTESAKLWDVKCYEHLFFINCDNLGIDELDKLLKFTVEDIEPHFVRNDNKLPCKNHMYSYISFIIITRNKPDDNVKLMIEKTNIVKKYMFGARGYSNIRLVCVTPSQFSVISNRYGKEISDYLKKMMSSGY